MNNTAPKSAGGAAAARNARLAKVHIAKKKLGLDDETYRQLLARLFKGKTSAGDLSVSQLDTLLEHFKAEGFKATKKAPKRAGKRPMAGGAEALKIRALWLSLYHLGAVRDPSEQALATYVQRTAGVAALQWLRGDQGTKAIEGLKAMAARAGVDWTLDGLGLWKDQLPRASIEPFQVVTAQWRRLVQLGVIQHPEQGCWQFAYAITGKGGAHFYEAADWHRLMERYGAMIRKAQARAGS